MRGKRSLYVLIAGVATTVMLVSVGYAKQYGSRPPDELAYLLSLASVAVSILLMTFGSDTVTAVLALIFIGIPPMGVFSFLAAPPVGYGGQIARFAAQSILAVVVGAGFAAKFLRGNGVNRERAFRQLFWGNLTVALVVTVTSRLALAPVDPTQRLGNGLLVKYVTADSGGMLSLPYISGDSCFVAGQNWLVEVDLSEVEVVSRVPLHRPDVSELGLDGTSLGYPPGMPEQARFYASPPGTLTLAYPYPVVTVKDGVSGKDWSNYIWVETNLPFEILATWRLGGEPTGEALTTEDPGPGVSVITFGDCSVDRSSPHEIKTTTPRGSDSFLLRTPWVWAVTDGDERVIVATNTGLLYVISRTR